MAVPRATGTGLLNARISRFEIRTLLCPELEEVTGVGGLRVGPVAPSGSLDEMRESRDLMQLPPWLTDVRDWYEKLWIASEGEREAPRRPRQVPGWLLALLPFLLIGAAVAVLLIAIAVEH